MWGSIDSEATELSPFENYDPSWGAIFWPVYRQDDPSLSINGVDSGLEATCLVDFAPSGLTLCSGARSPGLAFYSSAEHPVGILPPKFS